MSAYEGIPYDEFRQKVLVADLIRSDPHFTGASQEALLLAEKILSLPTPSKERNDGR